MENEGTIDLSNVNNTLSESSSSDECHNKFVRKLKRKIKKNLEEIDSESERDICRKKSRVFDDMPKYIEGNSCQNQEGFFGHLLDCSYSSSDNETR